MTRGSPAASLAEEEQDGQQHAVWNNAGDIAAPCSWIRPPMPKHATPARLGATDEYPKPHRMDRADVEPSVGCTKISPGCKNCYAETMAKRLRGIGVRGYENGFRLQLMPERLAEPLERRKPTVYFVNSMSGLFHEKVPFEYIAQVFEMMRRPMSGLAYPSRTGSMAFRGSMCCEALMGRFASYR